MFLGKEPRARRSRDGVSFLLQIEFFFELKARLFVFAFKVLEKAAAFVHFLEETAAGRMVLLVLLQVLRELLDFRGQDCDLHLWGTCVGRVRAELLNDFLLFLGAEHRSVY